MILLDVNVLVRAHWPDLPNSAKTHRWLQDALVGPEPIAIWDVILTSAYRILTHPNVVREPRAPELAMRFLKEVRDASVVVREGERYWELLQGLIEQTHSAGNLVTDASIAAVCIENSCRLATFDHDFARFKKLNWFEPMT